AVEHQHLAEERVLEQHEMLVLGLELVDDPLDLVGHADADVIEQRLGNPAFVGHDRHTSGRRSTARNRRRLRRRLSSDYVSCPRKSALLGRRWAWRPFRSRGRRAWGRPWPQRNKSGGA